MLILLIAGADARRGMLLVFTGNHSWAGMNTCTDLHVWFSARFTSDAPHKLSGDLCLLSVSNWRSCYCR